MLGGINRMKNKRSRLALFGVLALALSVTVGLSAGVAEAKKKGGGKAKTLNATGNGGAVPQGPTSAFINPIPFKGTATIGGKGKGKVVNDIDVTLSATAVAAAGSGNPFGDLVVRITGPNGATTGLVSGFFGTGGVSGSLISNLTLTDQTPTLTCAGDPVSPPPAPCGDPDATLLSPFSGRAQPLGLLAALNGGNAKGRYTLTAFDVCGDPACDSGTASITNFKVAVKAVAPPLG
jgi:hypothetical protein